MHRPFLTVFFRVPAPIVFTAWPGLQDSQTAQCKAKLDILLEQKQDLSSAIDQLLADIESGKKYMKVYKQMKMYNDPALNPVLYAKR